MLNADMNSSMSRRALTDKLRAADFALLETVLYLDAYPRDTTALRYYEETREKLAELTGIYEDKYGPLTAGSNAGETWNWIDGPWPWESGAN